MDHARMLGLSDLLPPDVVVRAGRVGEVPGALHPDEERFVSAAVSSRREAFRTGRVLAREALQALGVLGGPLPVGPDRAPVWPASVTGSITHSATSCAVAVALRGPLHGIGIDIEDRDRWTRDLADEVLHPDERATLVAVDPLLVFSMKESLFKCLFPIVGRFFGFQDVCLSPAGGRFTARPSRAAPAELAFLDPWLCRIDVRGAQRASCVVSAATV